MAVPNSEDLDYDSTGQPDHAHRMREEIRDDSLYCHPETVNRWNSADVHLEKWSRRLFLEAGDTTIDENCAELISRGECLTRSRG